MFQKWELKDRFEGKFRALAVENYVSEREVNEYSFIDREGED